MLPRAPGFTLVRPGFLTARALDAALVERLELLRGTEGHACARDPEPAHRASADSHVPAAAGCSQMLLKVLSVRRNRFCIEHFPFALLYTRLRS